MIEDDDVMEVEPATDTARPTPPASDNLMWIEKYRPNSLSDLISHSEIVSTLRTLISNNRLPHLLFCGPPGTGKTSTIVACARQMYGPAYKSMVLELNASDDRGINVVRDQIKSFASTRRMFSSGVKLVVLDEADAMTKAAQMALRRIVEKYVQNTRFCIICNYVNKIIPALQSRCTKFRFGPLPAADAEARVAEIAKMEGVVLAEGALDALLMLAQGDMRRALNVLQSAHMAAEPGVAITVNALYATTGAPHPADIDALWKWLREESFLEAARKARDLRAEKGLALDDLVQALSPRVAKDDSLSPKGKIYLYEQLADIEHRLAVGASEFINSSALVSAFKFADVIALDAMATS